LTNVNCDMLIASEEIFGPVASIFPFTTEEEVIDAANDTDVGLASYFFTQDVCRATRVAEQLQTGMVALNTGLVSDWGTP
jgi:succinate-semialdehyde dehydrogenase / glutarate-semialdehyde dehydrogenase